MGSVLLEILLRSIWTAERCLTSSRNGLRSHFARISANLLPRLLKCFTGILVKIILAQHSCRLSLVRKSAFQCRLNARKCEKYSWTHPWATSQKNPIFSYEWNQFQSARRTSGKAWTYITLLWILSLDPWSNAMEILFGLWVSWENVDPI